MCTDGMLKTDAEITQGSLLPIINLCLKIGLKLISKS